MATMASSDEACFLTTRFFARRLYI
jgi:hypothetical protein